MRATPQAFVLVIATAVLGQIGPPLFAQGSQSGPLEVAGISVSGSLRTRVESWDWFGSDPSGTYTYHCFDSDGNGDSTQDHDAFAR